MTILTHGSPVNVSEYGIQYGNSQIPVTYVFHWRGNYRRSRGHFVTLSRLSQSSPDTYGNRNSRRATSRKSRYFTTRYSHQIHGMITVQKRYVSNSAISTRRNEISFETTERYYKYTWTVGGDLSERGPLTVSAISLASR